MGEDAAWGSALSAVGAPHTWCSEGAPHIPCSVGAPGIACWTNTCRALPRCERERHRRRIRAGSARSWQPAGRSGRVSVRAGENGLLPRCNAGASDLSADWPVSCHHRWGRRCQCRTGSSARANLQRGARVCLNNYGRLDLEWHHELVVSRCGGGTYNPASSRSAVRRFRVELSVQGSYDRRSSGK
jgi:hypothetical protein